MFARSARVSTKISRAIPLKALPVATRPVVNLREFHANSVFLAEEMIKVPPMAESLTEGTLKQWLKKEGDFVAADEEVATIETDKIDVAVNAPKAGKIVAVLANEEDTVTVGQDLFKLDTDAKGGDSKPAESKQEVKEETKEKPKQEAAPKAEAASAPKETPAPSKASEATPQNDAPKPGNRNETRVKMSRMRLRIAERLKESQSTAAFLTTFNEIDMSALMAMRAKHKDEILKKTGIKLGFMSAFAKACAIALREIPAVNASLEGDELVYRDYVDLSVAVATPKGLVTPVIRNIEEMNFVQFEKALSDVGVKARDNKITLEDLSGGTFTISNGGVFGSLYGTPIINTPQAAVLGMHGINDKAVVVDGKIVIRPIMVVALTYDHRILDGREGVTFLVRVKQLIEDPSAMLLA